jgi:hypothetical protein
VYSTPKKGSALAFRCLAMCDRSVELPAVGDPISQLSQPVKRSADVVRKLGAPRALARACMSTFSWCEYVAASVRNLPTFCAGVLAEPAEAR